LASFEQHVNVTVIATGIVIAPLHAAGLLDINQSLVALGLGLVGGMLPDLDSNNSKPIQIVFKILSIFLPLLVLLAVFDDLSIVKMLIIWLGASLFLHLGVFKVFLSLTTHRGIFHSIPMGLLFGQLTTLAFYYMLHISITTSLISGFFIFFGFMTHLLLDEIFSVNALGLHIKKSFGTALKVYDRDNHMGSMVLYALVAILFFIIPLESEIFMNIFSTLKNVKII
jgi:hypothetical protein